jgi:hypothetical protein
MHNSTALPVDGATGPKQRKQEWDYGDKPPSPTPTGVRIAHRFATIHILLGMIVVATVVQP